jgi:hypothetical protein
VARDNFSRRVARAAAVGGSGRSYRNHTPLGWSVLLLVICLGGVSLVAYSRYERLHATPSAASKQSTEPPTTANLWKVGLVLDICGKVEHLPATTAAGVGITTNGRGIVTVEPGLATAPALYSGKNATLGNFLSSEGVVLTANTLQIPRTPAKSRSSSTTTSTSSTTSTSTTTTTTAKSGSTTTTTSGTTTTTTTTLPPKPITYVNGQACEGGKGIVQVKEWASPSAKAGRLVKSPTTLRLRDGQLITIAFAPRTATIPKPPNAKKIADFLVSNPGGVAPASVASGATSTTTTSTTLPAGQKGSTTTTTSSAGTTTTTSGSSSHKGSSKKKG